MLNKLKNIKLIICDVDGVLTDGYLLINERGDYLRRMNIKDGYALRYASDLGMQLAIISGAEQRLMKERFDKLGFQHVYTGIKNKLEAFEVLIDKLGLGPSECLFIGDDMLDIPLLKRVGVSCCPADACDDVVAIVDFISSKNGGQGCVREMVEKVLKIQGKWH